jgi:carbon-monoxide dehydrogenase medium subunit
MAHPASGYVVVSAGALLNRDSSGRCASARIAIGGLGSGPLRAKATEAALQGKSLAAEIIAAAAAKASDGANADDDHYASAEYKLHMATVYARRAIESAVRRAGG